MKDIFISHSSKDKRAIVRKLAKELRIRHLDVWVDEDNILCGDNVLEEIERGIKDCLCIALILTTSFFESNWTSLELGIAQQKKDYQQIIPILSDIKIETVAKKYPFLLNKKYLTLDKNSIANIADELAHTVEILKARIQNDFQLDYQTVVRKLNNFDTLGTNKVSILLAEYDQICRISLSAGLTHVTRIGDAIISDVYTKVMHSSDKKEISWEEKLQFLMTTTVGLSQNVVEYIEAIMTMPSEHFTNETDQKRLMDYALTAVLNWYTAYISTVVWHGNSEHYEVVSPGDLVYQDFIDMYQIDKMVLRADLIARPEITFGWYQYNIYTHIAVRSLKTGRIVGYFALLPITDDLFKIIQSGDFKDNDLSTDYIRQYNMADFYKLYVAAVCIHPNYQNTSAFNCLYHALIKMMYDLASEREVYITDIITEASTKQGEKLCKILGLKKAMDTNLNTELYTASLLPPSLRLNSLFGHKLIRFYQEKYNEMRELI